MLKLNFARLRDTSPLMAAALALIGACIWAYLPGLNGPFLFDDFATIADLGDLGGVRDWNSFKAFVFGGHAGPTGRPLALLSFLADGTNWPTDPWPFKRTNLVIHLICGVTLFVLTRQILLLLDVERRRAAACALVAAGCWLLHPFLVSTTLYVVQRMAQLSTLFIFAGMSAYLYGRTRLDRNELRSYIVMSAAMIVFTGLAMISKENGILLPVLVGVLEITILSSHRAPALKRWWAAVFIVAPTIVIALYLGERFFRDDFFAVAAGRDFSIFERLLTEFRVLADYLRHWFVPELYTTGVFQDHFIKSTGFLSPPSTLLTFLAHGAAVVAAIVFRRKLPLLAFAVLFFYAGHLIESTVLNLELYFEHRNYLAAAFLLLPVIVWLRQLDNLPLFVITSALFLVVLGGFTRYSATIWSDYRSIVEASASQAPTSARAQQQYATMLFNEGEYDAARSAIETAIQIQPENTSLWVTRSIIECQTGTLGETEFDEMAEYVSGRPYSGRQYELYLSLMTKIENSQCLPDAADRLGNLFEAMLKTPENNSPYSIAYSQIQFFIGYSNVLAGDSGDAVLAFKQSLKSRPGAGHAMLMAALLATNEFFDAAMELSTIAHEQLNHGRSGVLSGSRVSADDILEFQAKVRAEIAARDAKKD